MSDQAVDGEPEVASDPEVQAEDQPVDHKVDGDGEPVPAEDSVGPGRG